MVRQKKRTPRIVKDILIPIRFGVGAAVIGAAGTATQPLLPVGTANPLTSISQTAGAFAGPLTAIVGTGIVIRQVRKLGKKKKLTKL